MTSLSIQLTKQCYPENPFWIKFICCVFVILKMERLDFLVILMFYPVIKSWEIFFF